MIRASVHEAVCTFWFRDLCASILAAAAADCSATVFEVLAAIQNAVVDPLWTLSQKLLALRCLDTILKSCGDGLAQAFLELEWFHYLFENAVLLMYDYVELDKSSSQQDSLIPWIFYLDVAVRWNLPQPSRKLLLPILMRITNQCGGGSPIPHSLLLGLTKVWRKLLIIGSVPNDTRRDLRTFFKSVFKDCTSSPAQVTEITVFRDLDSEGRHGPTEDIPYGIMQALHRSMFSEEERNSSLADIVVETMRLVNQEGQKLSEPS